MGFVSFAGRVLFASVFLLSVYQDVIEFGVDGGTAAKHLVPKYDVFANHVTLHLGLLYLTFLTPILFFCYNYDIQKPEFVQLFAKLAQNLALSGALLFFLGMNNSIPKRKRKAPKTKMV